MTRYLLDTNILSEASPPRPRAAVANWIQNQADNDLFVSTLTIAEIWRGVLEMAFGRRRRNLEAWFGGAEGPASLFSGRIFPFDERAAMEWARIMAAGTAVIPKAGKESMATAYRAQRPWRRCRKLDARRDACV